MNISQAPSGTCPACHEYVTFIFRDFIQTVNYLDKIYRCPKCNLNFTESYLKNNSLNFQYAKPV